MASKYSVILLDDHRLVRAGLKALIDDLEGFVVVGTGDDGADCEALVNKHAPDVLVTDLQMRQVSGIEAMKRARELKPDIAMVVLSMMDDRENVLAATEAGASSYILKESAEIELEQAMIAAVEGRQFFSTEVSRMLLSLALSKPAVAPPQPWGTANPLTKRQLQVLICLAKGGSVKQVAYDLELSSKTVETHRAQILDRLGLRDTAGLIKYALRNHLIDLNE